MEEEERKGMLCKERSNGEHEEKELGRRRKRRRKLPLIGEQWGAEVMEREGATGIGAEVGGSREEGVAGEQHVPTVPPREEMGGEAAASNIDNPASRAGGVLTQRQITSFFKRPELNAGPRAESIQVSEDPGAKVQQSYFDDQNTELDDVGG